MLNEGVNNKISSTILNMLWLNWQDKESPLFSKELSERVFSDFLLDNNVCIAKIEDSQPIELFDITSTEENRMSVKSKQTQLKSEFVIVNERHQLFLIERDVFDEAMKGKKIKKRPFYFTFVLLK